jgi:alkylation response protein AidB-like acyl-CoA dehydrogenase
MPAFNSEERQLLHDSVQGFFQSQYNFEHFRKLSDPAHADGFDRAAWTEYANLGWLGVALPENAGGTAAGMTELGIIMAAAGSALALEPFLATVVLGASAIEFAGTPAQQSLLSDIGTGSYTLAFCHTEPDAGFARGYVNTIARVTDSGFSLSGEKSFALHAQAADALIVSARIGDADGPLALFVVPASASGITRKTAATLDNRRGASVTLTDVNVDGISRLGSTDQDQTATVDRILDRAVMAVCAEAAGAMETVTQQTVDYLTTREQFGQPLAKFQVLQHRLVDMNISSESARAATHAALIALDESAADAQTKVWRAKVQMARSARYVGGQAIQLHGGMGMTDELAIGHYYKRLTLCETMFGDAQWYLKQLANADGSESS